MDKSTLITKLKTAYAERGNAPKNWRRLSFKRLTEMYIEHLEDRVQRLQNDLAAARRSIHNAVVIHSAQEQWRVSVPVVGPEATGLIEFSPHVYGVNLYVNGRHLALVDLFYLSTAGQSNLPRSGCPQLALYLGEENDSGVVACWHKDSRLTFAVDNAKVEHGDDPSDYALVVSPQEATP